MRVEWTVPARGDLDEIVAFIGADNRSAAGRVIAAIEGATRRLRRLPRLGRPGRRPGTRELVVAGTRYTIVYRVGPDAVQVLRVLHHARQFPPAAR
ncbi:MAG: type II toxin-antitoxin system RelE/ParE family toxin [Alphaproteobacteria bacterium]|nr:type II toxin-antitoxin system RelE/ParE family toxin [Alphaproteobacteria bacterium]